VLPQHERTVTNGSGLCLDLDRITGAAVTSYGSLLAAEFLTVVLFRGRDEMRSRLRPLPERLAALTDRPRPDAREKP
jgi:hypothetical protein